MSSGCKGHVSLDEALGSCPFAHQLGERGNVAVTFDQRGRWSDASDELVVERPDQVADRRIVAVDEESALRIDRVTREVDFTNAVGRNGTEPLGSVEARVVGADGNVVHIDQQPAAASPGELRQEAGFAPTVIAKGEIMSWVLNQDLASKRILNTANVGSASRQHLVGTGHWQKVREAAAIQPRPSQML